MSTIAYDGKTLVGDKLAVTGSGRKHNTTKVFRLKDGRLFGGCGVLQDVIAVLDYLNGDPEKPEVCEDNFSGVIIDLNGDCFRIEDKLIAWQVETPYACGSGADYAICAMFLGKPAKEAIEIASKFDAFTGGGTDELVVERVGETSTLSACSNPASVPDSPYETIVEVKQDQFGRSEGNIQIPLPIDCPVCGTLKTEKCGLCGLESSEGTAACIGCHSKEKKHEDL